MLEYWILDKTKIVINSKIVDFIYNIYRILEISNKLFIHLDYGPNEGKGVKIPTNNLYAVNAQGETVWNVRNSLPYDYYVTYIQKSNDDQLVIGTYLGIKFTIDAKTMNIISKEITK